MANKLSGLQPVVISSPIVPTAKPAGLVPTVTPLPNQSGAATTPAIVPTAAQVSDLVQQSNQQAAG